MDKWQVPNTLFRVPRTKALIGSKTKTMDYLLKDIQPIEIVAGYNAKFIHIEKCF
jgi:hypothetical protein